MTYQQYEASMATSQKARTCLTEQIETHPELFPTGMAQGDIFNGWTEPLVASSCQGFRISHKKRLN